MRTHGEDGHLQATDTNLPAPDFGLLASRVWEKKFLLFSYTVCGTLLGQLSRLKQWVLVETEEVARTAEKAGAEDTQKGECWGVELGVSGWPGAGLGPGREIPERSVEASSYPPHPDTLLSLHSKGGRICNYQEHEATAKSTRDPFPKTRNTSQGSVCSWTMQTLHIFIKRENTEQRLHVRLSREVLSLPCPRNWLLPAF